MLKEHNIPIYNQLDNSVYNHIMVETATGTGKSFLGTQYIIDYAEKALVICPKRAICHEWNLMSDKITTMTYSGFSLLSKEDVDKLDYDIYILDEVHHIGSQHWGRNIRLLLKDNNKKIIGLTADGHRYSDGGKYVGDMFEEVIYGYDLEKAINNNILPKFTYVSAMYNISPISEDTTKNLKGAAKYNVDRLIKNFNYTVKEMQPINSIIKKHMPEGNRKCIVFVDKIEKINEAVSFIKSIYPKEECLIINSNLPRSKQIEAIRRFKNIKRGFIFAVDMFNEGLHIKGVNTLIMFRKTSSPTIFFQELGRALAFDSKDVVVFDLVGNANTLDISSINEDGIFKLGKARANTISQIEQVAVHDYTKDCIEILDQIKRAILGEWSEEEIEILKKYYPTEASKCKYRLDSLSKRTNNTINQKANSLNIHYDVKSWSNEELEILKKYYPIESINCRKRFPEPEKRSIYSIRSKANVLNIVSDLRKAPWSEEEINILKKYYPDEGVECKKRLPFPEKRNARSIRSKARQLNIKLNDILSKEKIDILKKHYPNEGTKCIDKLDLNVDKMSIRRIAKRLNIKFNKRMWTDEETDILKEYYPSEGTNVQKRLPDFSVAQIKTKAQRLNLKINPKWPDEHVDILKKYYTKEGLKAVSKRLPMYNKSQISNKVHWLGLKPKVLWPNKDIEILKKYYPIEGTEVIKRLSGQTKKQIHYKATALNIKMNKNI